MIEVYNLDAPRIWNLDETGSSPEKEGHGRGRLRRYSSRSRGDDARGADFQSANRVTFLPCVSAAGADGPPLLVFNSTHLTVRKVQRGAMVPQETDHDVLPRGAVVAMHTELGSVDSVNFLACVLLLIESTADLRKNGRHVLLVYDAYRSHLSFAVLELFQQNNIVAYALPAHTSGKTQRLDVVLFGLFKPELREVLINAVSVHKFQLYTMFYSCCAMREAFVSTYTRANIKASFKRSGIWPIALERLIDQLLLRTFIKFSMFQPWSR